MGYPFPSIARYKQETLSARTHLQAESQLYPTTAGIVEAAITGYGNPILISHGSGGGYDMGIWLAHLIGGDFQYVSPSRFGYLRSPLPGNPTPETQADTYSALLDTLDIDSVIIIGLSAGGASALQFALRHSARCKGLIMLSAVSKSIPPLPPIMRALYPFMLRSDFIPWLIYAIAPQVVFQGNGVSRSLLARIKTDQEKMRLLDGLYKTTFPSGPRRAGMLNDIQQLTTFPVYPIEKISAPTLVVHAVNDPIIPIGSGEYSAETIPHAKFLRVEDGGHFACVTHREETLPVINEFLVRYGS